MPEYLDVAVVGGGLVGLTASLALGQAGLKVANIAPAAGREDGRTTALLASSVAFLDELGVWSGLAGDAWPLTTIRIIDATGRLLRGPELAFHASEIGLEAFGYNIANKVLVDALKAACASMTPVKFIEGSVDKMILADQSQEVRIAGARQITTTLIVGADGRNSAIRQLAGIEARQWNYPQTALVMDFNHTMPHNNASTEFHTAEGPFTFVPLGERRCGLVWVQLPHKAEARMKMDKRSLGLEIERQMHSMLGKVEITSPIQAWPMSGLIANRFGVGGVVLAGEAAHVFPPIGAQGFNLGIRDVEMLAEIVKSTPAAALGSIGPAYHLRRAGDIGSRTLSVDLLNRSLLSDFLPVQMLRLAGLHAIANIGPLRRLLMREGAAPGAMARPLATPETATGLL